MNSKRLMRLAIAGALLAGAAMGSAQARDQIRIVGSSTVYPFSSYVAEEFGATTNHSTPVVESTGSGGGMKLFCEGVALNTPDITNASRRMKVSEFERCQENGVNAITEVMIGYDGIVVAQAKGNAPLSLSREELTLAVAAQVPRNGKLVPNPYSHWNQINAKLPKREILIYGPPSTSGTRDAFEELVMEAATEEMAGYGEAYTKIRQDGKYVPSGENDNLIVQKLVQNKDALGIFGFSFLEENRDRIQGESVDGVEPKRELISSGEYPISRSLFFYVKQAHLDKVPGIADYVKLFVSEKMIGDMGYLKSIGLIPLPEGEREAMRERVESWQTLKLGNLK